MSGTIVKLQKDYHLIDVSEPHIQSPASYLLLKNIYKLRERKEGRTAVPEWRRWLTYRNKYLKKQKKLNKGNLVCSYCGTQYLDANTNNPFRKRERRDATVDHIVAQANGGDKYSEDNMCVCCSGCNGRKKDLSVEEFKRRDALKKEHLVLT